MSLFSFFKPPQNQRYAYKPQYWDPDKERIKERIEQLENISDNSPEAVKKRLANGFRRGYAVDPKLRSKQVSRSNIILLGIIIILIFLSYLFLTVYLPDIVKSIEG